MKSIELTQEHKDKLVEMCKVLFPEYNRFIGFYKTEDEIFYKKDKIYKFNMLHLIGDNDIKIIHWFEFCMTHLINKLFESFEEDDEDFYDRHINNGASFYGVGVNEMIFVMLNSKKHPVDYLYEEFKKLKL